MNFILAGYLGNRALIRVANSLKSQGVPVRFGQLILAAPDVDAGTFLNLADAYSSMADRTTLYISDTDHAAIQSLIPIEIQSDGVLLPLVDEPIEAGE